MTDIDGRLSESERDRRNSTETSKREVRWGLIGALLAALVALASGAVTAKITSKDASAQSQLEFERSQRIQMYSQFANAYAAWEQDVGNFFRELLNQTSLAVPTFTPLGKPLLTPVGPSRVDDMITTLLSDERTLSARAAQADFVANCPVRQAATRVINAVIVAEGSFENLQVNMGGKDLDPETYTETVLRDFTQDNMTDFALAFTDFEGQVRTELNIDSGRHTRLLPHSNQLDLGVEHC